MRGEYVWLPLTTRQSVSGNKQDKSKSNKPSVTPTNAGAIPIQSAPIYCERGRRVAIRRLGVWSSQRVSVHNRETWGKRVMNNRTHQFYTRETTTNDQRSERTRNRNYDNYYASSDTAWRTRYKENWCETPVNLTCIPPGPHLAYR